MILTFDEMHDATTGYKILLEVLHFLLVPVLLRDDGFLLLVLQLLHFVFCL